MLFCYFLALLSRESSLILPVLLLLYHFAFREKIRPAAFLAILSAALLYIVARLTLLAGILPAQINGQPLFRQRFWENIPGFFVAIASYLRLLIFPVDLHMEYGKRLFSLTDPLAVIGLLITFFMLVYTFINRQRKRIFFFACCWFFIALLPVSNLYPLNAYMAEHWLYLPSLGFFLALAAILSLLARNEKTTRFAAAASLILVVGYSLLTIKQNAYWREPVSFFNRTLRYAPNSARMLNNLGVNYIQRGEYDQAISCFNRALEIRPLYEQAYNNRGLANNVLGEYAKAIADFDRALEINPASLQVYNNRGLTFGLMGEHNKAICDFTKVLEFYPGYARAYNNRARAYFMIKEYAKARMDVREAQRLGLQVDPDFLKDIRQYSHK